MTSPDPRSPASTWNYFTFVDCETSRLSFLHVRSSSVSLTPLLFRANYFSALFSFLPSFTNLTHLNIQYIVHSSSNLLEILPTTRKYLEEYLREYFLVCDSRFIQIINLRWICYEDRNSRVSTASMIGFASLFWCKRIYSKSHADETSDRNTNHDRAVLHACLHVYLRGISIDWFGDCTVRFRLYSSSSRNYWNFRFVLFSSFFSLFWFAYTR